MLVDIKFNEKTQSSTATFELVNLNTENDLKQCLAIVTVLAADYYLDPEIEVEQLQDFIKQGLEKEAKTLCFFFDEDGLELEIL